MKRNTIQDGLFGMCVGDALGVPVEFKTREYLTKNPVKDMIGYGTYNQPPGTWSDDSSLAFCLAESLCNGYNPADIGNNFCKYYFEAYWTPYGKVFDIGNTTLDAILNLNQGVNPLLAGGNSENNNSNGSLMRILPVSFLTNKMSLQDTIKYTKEISSITHRTDRTILACSIYTLIANDLINNNSKEESYKNMQKNIPILFRQYPLELKKFKRILEENIADLQVDEIKSSGYVVDSLEASLWCFMKSDTYSDTVLSAVNLGEDTDTIAAIAGGIAGIYYGIESIPKKWLDKIPRKNDISELSEKLYASLNKT